ncbi:MAG: long-chain fatty acid--CoA ligase, partial [Gemmatimonadota bacterium]|nr:long-chain fatty acid--CoA ligase [Gemmatimonadota bacterium]
PLLIAVPAQGATPTRDEVLTFLGERLAKWQVPDDVVFVEQLPMGGTGKVQKSKLREEYGG